MNGRSTESAITRFGKALLDVSALPGKYGSILILILVLVVLVAVVGAQMGWSDLASWDRRLPLIGSHLNMTSIAELQWHLFSLLIMVSGAYALKEDRHIRVDIVSTRLKPRTRIWIDILGDLFLLIPFSLCLRGIRWLSRKCRSTLANSLMPAALSTAIWWRYCHWEACCWSLPVWAG